MKLGHCLKIPRTVNTFAGDQSLATVIAVHQRTLQSPAPQCQHGSSTVSRRMKLRTSSVQPIVACLWWSWYRTIRWTSAAAISALAHISLFTNCTFQYGSIIPCNRSYLVAPPWQGAICQCFVITRRLPLYTSACFFTLYVIVLQNILIFNVTLSSDTTCKVRYISAHILKCEGEARKDRSQASCSAQWSKWFATLPLKTVRSKGYHWKYYLDLVLNYHSFILHQKLSYLLDCEV